jgi:hypothetical protein
MGGIQDQLCIVHARLTVGIKEASMKDLSSIKGADMFTPSVSFYMMFLSSFCLEYNILLVDVTWNMCNLVSIVIQNYT